MKSILITNNPMSNEKYKDKIEIVFLENSTYLELLKAVRDYIHKGHTLLTHPLMSSIKPNETPYKSVLVSKECTEIDFDSLSIIEESIESCEKFLMNKKTPNWTDKIKEDFALIDCDLIGYPISIEK